MTEEFTGSVRAIHCLERSIRALELVRDTTQQAVDQALARCEKQGGSAETNPTVAKARANLAVYNRAILKAKARIGELERREMIP